MPVPSLTVDEIIETIKHSSLPTIFCEGTTDFTVLRYVEDLLDPIQVSFFPCGGRDTLLAVFDRRSELAGRFVFLADRDTWVFTRIPARYRGIVFTWGYSIENDLLDGSLIERLLDRHERERFEIALKEVIRWYAFEINKLPARPNVGAHIAQILEARLDRLSDSFLRRICFVEAPAQLIERIENSYKRLLRGKTWAELLVRLLSHSTRRSKYQYVNLWEISIKLLENKRLLTIIKRLRAGLHL